MNRISIFLTPFLFFLLIRCNQKSVKVIINTPTIQCGMCQKTIEMGLGRITGITASKVDLETKTTTVAYNADKTDPDKIEKTISELGYQANEILPNPIAYNALAPCCKIGGMDKK